MIKNKIYLSVLIFIIGIFIALPLIKIPVSTSARGVVRSAQENVPITVMVGGRVIKSKLEKNNQNINKGDTLLVITAEQLNTQKELHQNQSADYQAQLSDLAKISSGNFTGLQTGQYQREVSAMQEKIAQIQTELSFAKKELERATLLHNQGVLPRADYDKVYYNYKGLQNQVANIKEQQIAQWQVQKRETERQLIIGVRDTKNKSRTEKLCDNSSFIRKIDQFHRNSKRKFLNPRASSGRDFS